MTEDKLKELLRTYMYDEDVTTVMSAVRAYSSALIAGKPLVSGRSEQCEHNPKHIVKNKNGTFTCVQCGETA